LKEEIAKLSINKQNNFKTNLFKAIYFKVFRKLVFLSFIVINVVYHGLQVEFYPSIINYQSLRLFEIVILALLLMDLVIVQIFFVKFVTYFNLDSQINEFITIDFNNIGYATDWFKNLGSG
jgi:hypothetical protein